MKRWESISLAPIRALLAASDAVPLTYMLGGVAGTQTLYTSVGQ